jgi:nitric oxide dioxygenase
MLTESQLEIIRATVPVLQVHGETITRQFYKFLFEENPELKNVFNMAHQVKCEQPRALADAVIAYAANIDKLQNLGPAVSRIAHKHCSLDVKAEHYPIVGRNLLKAIGAVLGDAATPEIVDAWAAAYGQLAEIMIGVEGGMYEANRTQPGGWNGFKPFRVAKKTVESEVIASFTLVPADGQPLPAHQAGQYLSVKFQVPGNPYTQMRQYTVSCAPNPEHYRISVKREPGGVVSNHLHDAVNEGDEVLVHVPQGEFQLDEAGTGPVALLSGGVGITPMLAMLERLVAQQSERRIVFVHSAIDGSVHAFGSRLREIVAANPNVETAVFYDTPRDADIRGEHYDQEGRVSHESLRDLIPSGADCYFCGPKGFMATVDGLLADLGVSAERRHVEFFGPASALSAPAPEVVTL